jgi:hypothetical protein
MHYLFTWVEVLNERLKLHVSDHSIAVFIEILMDLGNELL